MTFGKSQPYRCPACRVLFRNQAALANHGRYNKACTPETRFWARVEKRGPRDCWHWQGRKDASGYGRLARKGPMVYAHRVAWIFTNGPVPRGKDILHRCDQRDCCNTAHYFLGTQQENNRDMWKKGRAKTKLKPPQVLEIRAAFRGVKTKKAVMALNRHFKAKYGIAHESIWAIRARTKWKDAELFGDNDAG